ncbi:hypothetical protein M885DRAFT_246871 [Pelagophyceae sp. CCMP2097]|nr:hypothetical protein M885DRAFT_246871 [Pelagophyceae sp. CCMP2097]
MLVRFVSRIAALVALRALEADVRSGGNARSCFDAFVTTPCAASRSPCAAPRTPVRGSPVRGGRGIRSSGDGSTSTTTRTSETRSRAGRAVCVATTNTISTRLRLCETRVHRDNESCERSRVDLIAFDDGNESQQFDDNALLRFIALAGSGTRLTRASFGPSGAAPRSPARGERGIRSLGDGVYFDHDQNFRDPLTRGSRSVCSHMNTISTRLRLCETRVHRDNESCERSRVDHIAFDDGSFDDDDDIALQRFRRAQEPPFRVTC